jgi:glutathione S-transferase
MLTLHQFEISPFCDKIRRVLNVKGVAYETREVGLLEAQLGYRKVNPAGKVPALVDEAGHVVCDSTEIAYHLEARYPHPPLVPRDPRDRALMHVLEDWADESLYFLEVRLRLCMPHNRARTLPRLLAHENVVMRTLGPWILPRVLQSHASAQGVGRKSDALIVRELERHLDALAALLAGRDYLVGNVLTLADIAVYAQLFAIGDSVEGAAGLATRREVVAFMDRVDGATRGGAASRAA